ncbi:MAG: sigma-70 family RNA polymerase sigma factor [Chloroflexota bacterium]
MPLEEEAKLVSGAKAGDSEAFGRLYRAYVQSIHRYLFLRLSDTSLAEDLTAEVFLRAVDGLPRYIQRGLPFGAWLFRIARDRLVDYYRQSARRPRAELDDDLPSDLPEPSDSAVDSETAETLREALAELTDEQRDVIQFRFMEEWSLEETARVMNKSVNAVKALQHRALNVLNRFMKGNESRDSSA